MRRGWGRAAILAILLGVTLVYAYELMRGTMGPWKAVLAALACALLVFFSERRRRLIVRSLRLLAGMGFIGFSRALITGEPILPGVVALGLILCVLIALEAYWPHSDLVETEAIGEDSEFVELKLGSGEGALVRREDVGEDLRIKANGSHPGS